MLSYDVLAALCYGGKSRPVRKTYLTRHCYLSMMILAFGMNLSPVFLTELQNSYRLSPSEPLTGEELGRLTMCPFVGLVLSILAASLCVDKYGAKPVVLGGNALMTLGLFLAAVAKSYSFLGFSLFLMGFGSGSLDMVLSPVISRLNPDARASEMNYLHALYCVGAVVVTVVGLAARSSEAVGWRGACAILLFCPLIPFFGMLRETFPDMTGEATQQRQATALGDEDFEKLPTGGKSGDSNKSTPPPTSSLKALLKEPYFVLSLFTIFLGGSTEMGLAQWLPTFVEKVLHYPEYVGGLSLTLFSIAMALGRLTVGWIGPRLSGYDVLLLSASTSTVLLVLGSFSPSGGLAITSCVAVGFTGSAMWPTILGITADKYPSGGAVMFGVLAALGNFGGVVMPWLVGAVYDASNLRVGLAIAAFCPFFMFPMLLRMKTLWRKDINGTKTTGGAASVTFKDDDEV